MAKFSEETFNTWRYPPSNAEETKLQNAEKLVRAAIAEDPKLSKLDLTIFGQGSYANDTNVRLNSDIDINIRYDGAFYYDIPEGKTRSDYGFNSPSQYSFAEFKIDLERAMVRKFGRTDVHNYDKCITVDACDDRVEIDVVPTFKYRYYFKTGGFREGVQFLSNKGIAIRNYPLQHIENGKTKNSATQKRFKRLTRIFRKVRYKMIDDGHNVSDGITSFLLECLVWNVPNDIMNNNDTWTDRLTESIRHLYHATKTDEGCNNWVEVSKGLYLFINRKWSRQDVNNYLLEMWTYLEFNG